LKHQKEFSKIMINNPKDYDSFIDSEWKLVQEKLDSIVKSKFDLILDSKVRLKKLKKGHWGFTNTIFYTA
jgi:hypothetical protein